MIVDATSEMIVRLGCFFGVFILLAVLEANLPRRQRLISRWQRWPSNIGISFINQIVVRLVVPVTALVLAFHGQQNGWGLLNLVEAPVWLEIAIGILLLDLAIYLQHLVYHHVPFLWRLHRMHHADVEFDVTTGIRFHPVSVLISAGIKLAAVAIIGPAVLAVLIFEILLNATSLLNHSNLYIAPRIDRLLRNIVVTPDMHRVHHSADPAETNTNFGFNFPWWDRMFRTYRSQPALGHAQMVVGLAEFRGDREMRLDRMLLLPWRDEQVDNEKYGATPSDNADP